MQDNNNYQVLLFYKYVHLKDPEVVCATLRESAVRLGLTGRGIIASEGINITLEGKTTDTETFLTELQRDERFLDIHFKRSIGTGKSFRKLSMKTRNEIVSLHLGTCDIDPNQMTGKRCLPEMLHQWIAEDKEFYIVDMRNVYEHAVGHFKGSILPELENFRDLPKVVRGLKHLKDKTVLTVCTGGVRCEKASGYLVSQGFNDVWQLDGGIVSYMEQYPNENFLGKLYVFDKRMAMGFYTDDTKHEIVGKCQQCGAKSEHFINCDNSWCGKHFILCEECTQSQQKGKGNRTCPDKCVMRHPNKIKKSERSLWRRVCGILSIMFKKSKNKGFTLIELLVVIAIIAVLSSIVVVAVGAANAKAKLAGVQKGMHEVRSQIEIYYLGNNLSYFSACDNGKAPDGTIGLHAYNDSIGTKALGTSYGGTSTNPGGAAQTNTTGICWAERDKWITSMPYKADTYYCSDSTGLDVIKATPQASYDFTCA